MSDTDPATTAALDAGALVLPSNLEPYDRYEIAEMVLEAARPLIVEAERQRIRRAREGGQTSPVDGSVLYLIPAKVLDGDGDE